MPSVRPIRLAFIIVLVMALLHGLAMTFFLYSFYWWFDLPLHFLGGFCAALVSLYFYSFFLSKNVSIINPFIVFVTAIFGAAVVGLAWEIFEYFAGLTFNALGNYPFDTAKDLTVDVLGGGAAFLYFLSHGFHKNF